MANVIMVRQLDHSKGWILDANMCQIGRCEDMGDGTLRYTEPAEVPEQT